MDKYYNALSPSSVLCGSQYNYKIEKVLGQGAFGITYLAKVSLQGQLGQLDSNVCVTIKEFFMKEINGREGTNVTSSSSSKGGIFYDYKVKFAREAKNLSKLKHPNIVNVMDYFEANNTCYYVMEYLSGGDLDTLIEKQGGLSEEETIRFTKQIGSALSFMHQNKMLHLDLKPKNVMLNAASDAILIDFGLSKQYDSSGEPESSTTVGRGTPGYAPLEQANYQDGHGFPVTMDVYALGATMYKMLTGVRAPEASVILNDSFPEETLLSHGVSERTIGHIKNAMSPLTKDRFQSVERLIDVLYSDNYEKRKDTQKNSIGYDSQSHGSCKNDWNEFADIYPKEIFVGKNIDKIVIVFPYKDSYINLNVCSEGEVIISKDVEVKEFKIDWTSFVDVINSACLSIKFGYGIDDYPPIDYSIAFYSNNDKHPTLFASLSKDQEEGNLIGNVENFIHNLIELPEIFTFINPKETNLSFNSFHGEICNICFNRWLGKKGQNNTGFCFNEYRNVLILALADGMSANEGAVASAIAIKEIRNFFKFHNHESESLETKLQNAIKTVNDVLYRKAIQNQDLHGLSTTLAVLVVSDRMAYTAHIGNSRIYQLRKGKIIYRTNDDSVVSDMILKGTLSEEQARLSDNASIITKVLGKSPIVNIEVSKMPYKKNDRFVLCCDGVWRAMPEPELIKLFNCNKNHTRAVEEITNKLDEVAIREKMNTDFCIIIADTKNASRFQYSLIKQIKNYFKNT